MNLELKKTRFDQFDIRAFEPFATVAKENMAETSPPWLVNKDVTKWGVLVDGSTVSGKAFDAAVSFLCYHVAPIKSRNGGPRNNSLPDFAGPPLCRKLTETNLNLQNGKGVKDDLTIVHGFDPHVSTWPPEMLSLPARICLALLVSLPNFAKKC